MSRSICTVTRPFCRYSFSIIFKLQSLCVKLGYSWEPLDLIFALNNPNEAWQSCRFIPNNHSEENIVIPKTHPFQFLDTPNMFYSDWKTEHSYVRHLGNGKEAKYLYVWSKKKVFIYFMLCYHGVTHCGNSCQVSVTYCASKMHGCSLHRCRTSLVI